MGQERKGLLYTRGKKKKMKWNEMNKQKWTKRKNAVIELLCYADDVDVAFKCGRNWKEEILFSYFIYINNPHYIF